MDFIRENSRTLAIIIIAIINSFFANFEIGEDGVGFLEMVLTEFSFTLGSALVLITGYVGERRAVEIEPNTTLTSAVAVVTVLLPVLAPGTDWSALFDALNIFAATGSLTYGAILAVLINYFADIRVGRGANDTLKLDEPVKTSSFDTRTQSYRPYQLSDFFSIVAFGKRK